MHFLKIIFTIFLLISITGLAAGDTYKVVASGGHSDQDNINDALKKAKDNPGSTVYLSSENGPFVIDGSIKIGDDTVLAGDENTKIEIWEGSGQWFVINQGMIIGDSFLFPPDNYVIHDIYLDGQCHKFPMKYADFVFPGGSGTHNSMWGINIRGYSTLGIGYMKNISIYNVTVENTFCDGIRLAYAENVYIHDNTLINCQHEGIYFVSVINFIVEDNYIEGVISDCIRIDNGVRGLIQYNYIGSYDGNNITAPYKFGHQGIQIGNQGRSFNSGSAQPTDTNNIEVRGNVFEGKKRMNIWLHNGENVYIHDNEFRDGEPFETSGTPVNVDLGDFSYREEGDHVRRVPAVVEKGEQVVGSIFDIFTKYFYSRAGENEKIILPEGTTELPSEVTGTIEYYKVGDTYTTFVKIPIEGLSEVHYEVLGETAIHTLMVGEKTSDGIVFTQTSIWEGNLSHEIDALKLDGKVEKNDIKVTCITPKSTFEPELKTVTTEFKTVKFDPYAVAAFCVVILIGLFIRMSLKYI